MLAAEDAGQLRREKKGMKDMVKVKTEQRIAVSVPEAAAMIGVSPGKAYQMVHSGELPAKQVGKRWLVSVKKLEEWINEA